MKQYASLDLPHSCLLHRDLSVFLVIISSKLCPITCLTIIFFSVYKQPGLNPGRGQNIYNCDYDRSPAKGQVCNVDVNKWKPCHVENEFGYHKSTPCIFLKLNRIYGWIPEYYNDTMRLNPTMPRTLIEYIAQLPPKEVS